MFEYESDIAVNVKTQEEWNILTRALEVQGYKWSRSKLKPSTKNFFYNYGVNTCIRLHQKEKTLSYCSSQYYIEKGIDVIRLEKYLEEPKTAITRRLVEAIKSCTKTA